MKITSLLILIKDNNTFSKTSLHFIPIEMDSVKLIWEGRLATSANPIKRLQVYLKSQELKKDWDFLLEKIKTFFSKAENIYDVPIRHQKVVDSILISTYAPSKGYPSIEFIYNLVDQLKSYSARQSAKETGYPMLNISTSDSINYLTRVAIPVNKKLKSSGNISYKWMLGGGNILSTEVKGGFHSIDKAFKQLENYVNDHNRTAPAIPFQSLVTDRMQERDTSKWITRIYYPVI